MFSVDTIIRFDVHLNVAQAVIEVSNAHTTEGAVCTASMHRGCVLMWLPIH